MPAAGDVPPAVTPGSAPIEDVAAVADWSFMSISAVGSSPSPSAASFETEREVSVMKKSKDVEKETAASLIELVKKAPTAPGRIDTYA